MGTVKNVVARLEELQVTGEYHHATARQQGSRTDLYIYRKEDNGFNGYCLDCSTSSWRDDYDEVNSMISGINVGSFGRG